MFQLVMFLVVLGAEPSPPRMIPEPSFSTHEECVESIPEFTFTFHKAFSAHGKPFVLALGCMKTGERS
jgi:hypothetical protein